MDKKKRCIHKKHEGPNPLPLTEFYNNKGSKDGLHSYCKACCRKDASRHNKKRRQRIAHRKSHLKNAYDVTPEWYKERLELQGGRCAICRHLPDKGKDGGKFMVDHDHKTGQARGLLCRKCNTGLGYFEDMPSRFLAAAVYINLKGAIYEFPESEDSDSGEAEDTR